MTDVTAAVPITVGGQLREARESQSLLLEEIARQTRVPVRHLVQIEEGSLKGLPAAPYSAGFVKSYARAVGLDPVALSHAFRAEFDAANRDTPRRYEPYEPVDPVRLPPRSLALVAAIIAILLLVSYGVWRSGMLSGDDASERAKLAATGDDGGGSAIGAPTAVPAATAPVPAAAVATGGAVRLAALQPVWIKVSEREGATLFLGVLDRGKTFDVPATAADPVIRTGRPEAIDVTVGGRAVAPLGEPARIISNVSLKAAALLAKPMPAGATPAVVAAPPPPVTGNTADNQAVPSAFRSANGSPPNA